MRKLLLVLAMVCLLSSFAFAANIDPALIDAMKGAENVPVIVMMNDGAKHVDVAQLGGKLGYTYSIINGFSAELPVAAIDALKSNPNVMSVSLDKEITIDLDTAVCAVNADDLWSYGYDGSGVLIAIVDTGICPHADFQNRIIDFRDYINGRTTPYDDHYHGTHCAGIAAGNGSTYDGPARAANLIGAKVLSSSGSGSSSGIINGVNWAVSRGADVISMSLGGTVTQSSQYDPMCTAVRNAWNAGCVVVVAAGNSGRSGYYTIGTPGNEPKVITVGATDDGGTCSINNDIVADFSSKGPTDYDYWVKPDVVAPGVNITAADGRDCSGYYTISGTSMATPLVAGVCAQLLEAHPTASNQDIKDALMNTARDIMNHTYERYIQGMGLIDALAAHNYL